MMRLERGSHRLLQAGPRLDDRNRLPALLDRALPGVDRSHPGDDVDAGGELLAHERLADRKRALLVGEGRVDEKGLVHAMPPLQPGAIRARRSPKASLSSMTRQFETIALVASPTPEAQAALSELQRRYPCVSPEEADVVVALGGDGLMLQSLHRFMGTGKPIYGMNKGSVGFLMNDFKQEDLIERLEAAERSCVHPLLMIARDIKGAAHTARAINEVSMLRQTYQAAKLRISIDGQVRLGELIADGLLIATPAGSTAYNLSVNGPILPLNAPLLALTPISAFRPRRWRGALLPDHAQIHIDVIEADQRPVSAVADHTEFRRVAEVDVGMDRSVDLVMLHDPGHNLDERILREQFGY